MINVLTLAGCLLWPLMAFGSIFFFDAPGANRNNAVLLLALSVWVYPIPAFIGSFLFWLKLKTSTNQQLIIYSVISSSGYLFIFAMSIYLEVACNGKFACN